VVDALGTADVDCANSVVVALSEVSSRVEFAGDTLDPTIASVWLKPNSFCNSRRASAKARALEYRADGDLAIAFARILFRDLGTSALSGTGSFMILDTAMASGVESSAYGATPVTRRKSEEPKL
jgi:hypothetical protein